MRQPTEAFYYRLAQASLRFASAAGLASDYGWPKLNVSLGIDAAYAAGIIPPTTAPRSYVRLDWFVGLLRWLYCRERKIMC